MKIQQAFHQANNSANCGNSELFKLVKSNILKKNL